MMGARSVAAGASIVQWEIAGSGLMDAISVEGDVPPAEWEIAEGERIQCQT